MKLLAKMLFALVLTGLLSMQLVWESANRFLLDTLGIHASSISGSLATIQEASIAWDKQSADFSRLEIRTSLAQEIAPLVQVSSSHLQWDKTLKPLISSNSLLPDILALDELTLQDLTILYDADSEGGNLITLRKNIADSANTYLRQRLNAGSNASAEMPQRFTIRKLHLKGIRVDAKSTMDKTRQKTFPIRDLQYTDMGIQENGISMPEIINRITEDMAAAIHQQALAQGVIDPPEIIAITPTEKTTRLKTRADKARNEQSSEETDTPPEDSKVKKAAKNTGDAIKKLSRKLFGDKG